MNIVHINNTDLPGRRFNGHDLQIDLNRYGHTAYQLVADKQGNDNHTISFLKPYDHINREAYMDFEKRMSMQSLIYPYGQRIMKMPELQKADVVHYHLIHNHFISLFDFRNLVKMKPSVWTLHDPWAFTGHCIYPMDCDKWKTGCFGCTHLDLPFPMRHDKASQMWKIKKEIYSKLNIDIVVASKFMLNFVKESPLMSTIERVHLIPFGLKLDKFIMDKSRAESRKLLGIPEEHFVIMFRADTSPFKGLPYIMEMLKRLNLTKATTLLTVGRKDLLNKFKRKFNVVDFDWVNDDNLLTNLYSACDVFLMPSTAEAFGLMAIEAMAAARPVVVFEGTSLPDVTFSPDCGVLVKQGDVLSLCKSVERLMDNPQECMRRGELGRKLVQEHYSYDKYFNRLLELYKDVVMRSKRDYS